MSERTPTDLARVSQPVGGLFSTLGDAEAARAFHLSEEEIAFYDENGFVAGRQVLNDEQVLALRDELDQISRPEHDGNDLFYEFHTNESTNPGEVVFHALGAWRVSPGFHDLLWHIPWTIPASQLLRGPVRFWHDQLFCKPPRAGGVVAWHQDYSYWTRTKPMAHLTCWIGLDDTTEESGCLMYVPGSHRWGLLPITGLAGDMDKINEVLTPEQRTMFQPIPVPLKKGQASFHHSLTIHGSQKNRSAGPRRATIINVVRDGVRSGSDEPLLAGVPVISKGSPLRGQFFPLLFDPAAIGI